MRLIFKTSSVTPDFFYFFNLILSFSTCSESFEKIRAWELLGANVLNIRTLEFFPPTESWLVNSNFSRASRMQGWFYVTTSTRETTRCAWIRVDICCQGWRNPIGPRAIKDFFTRIFKVFTKFPEWRETTSLIDEMRKQVCKQANNSCNTKLFFPLQKVNVRTKNYPVFFLRR